MVKRFEGVKTKIPKPEYKIGTRVRVTCIPKSPMGRITHQLHDEYGWKHKVQLYDSKSTAKYWSKKCLRKVRSDAKK